MLAVERCHLVIEGAGRRPPNVASLATLADDEADLGAAVIDMGGGKPPRWPVFGGWGDSPTPRRISRWAGRHVTPLTIARGLNTPASTIPSESKRSYGSVLAGGADERDMIKVELRSVGMNANRRRTVSRAALTRIIKPEGSREILEILREPAHRFAPSPPSRRAAVILTGRRLPAYPDYRSWRRAFLGRPVRVRPARSAYPGCRRRPPRGPAFAAAAGLLVYPQGGTPRTLRTVAIRGTPRQGPAGYIARVGRWASGKGFLDNGTGKHQTAAARPTKTRRSRAAPRTPRGKP